MEGIKKKCMIICFYGTKKNIGVSTVSLNLAAELVYRNFEVLYGNSFESNKDFSFLQKENFIREDKEEKEIFFLSSKIEGLKLLAFSKDASRMSPQKIEKLLVGLPEAASKQGEFFIFNINDPFNFPDRYVLLHADIHIIVARVESTIFSDIFQLYEKLAFLPARPSELFIVFNNTCDLERAFETYLQLLKQADELKLNIKFYFLGLLPNDLLRQSFSIQLKLPARLAFPDSSFKGAISFMADKIVRLSSKENGVEEQLLLEDTGSV